MVQCSIRWVRDKSVLNKSMVREEATACRTQRSSYMKQAFDKESWDTAFYTRNQNILSFLTSISRMKGVTIGGVDVPHLSSLNASRRSNNTRNGASNVIEASCTPNLSTRPPPHI